MGNLTLPAPTVPAEFVGLARDFRRRVKWEADLAEMVFLEQVFALLRRRISRQPLRRLRDWTLADIAACWRDSAPHAFRLAFQTELEPRGRYGCVNEMRLLQTDMACSTWIQDEPGIAIVVRGLSMPKKCAALIEPGLRQHAIISLHALAHRYQRSGDRSDKTA